MGLAGVGGAGVFTHVFDWNRDWVWDCGWIEKRLMIELALEDWEVVLRKCMFLCGRLWCIGKKLENEKDH